MPSLNGMKRRIEISNRLRPYAADTRSLFGLLLRYNTTSLRRRFRRPLFDAPVGLRFRGTNFLAHLNHSANFAAFLEVFDELQYDVTLPSEPKVIVDLGSNVGYSVLFFHLKYPTAVIHAVEPDPASFEALEKNTRGLANVVLHNLAVAGETGHVRFYRQDGGSISSSMTRRSSRDQEILVPSLTLDALLERVGTDPVDLLKFDVEGAEASIFRTFRQFDRVRNAIGEVHPDLMDCSHGDFVGLFKGFDVHVREWMGVRSLVEFSRSR